MSQSGGAPQQNRQNLAKNKNQCTDESSSGITPFKTLSKKELSIEMAAQIRSRPCERVATTMPHETGKYSYRGGEGFPLPFFLDKHLLFLCFARMCDRLTPAESCFSLQQLCFAFHSPDFPKQGTQKDATNETTP